MSQGRASTSAAGATAGAARTAARLGAARRVLVTGFHGVAIDAVRAAFDVAEAIGAAIDAGDPEAARPAAPTIARVGELTADRGELRDRADLVILWFCDPTACDPGFVEGSGAAPHGRRAIAVGPAPVTLAGVEVVHAPCRRDVAVEAARTLELMLLRGDPPAHVEPAVAAACRDLHAAVDRATCVAFVTDDSVDHVGLEPWSVVHLVRAIAHRRPAFEIPLRPRAAAFDAACTWRYGAAGAIARADRAGAEFLPGEAAAERLVERGEVDAVLVVGAATAGVERALADAGDRIDVVRIAAAGSELVAELRALLAAIGHAPPGAVR